MYFLKNDRALLQLLFNSILMPKGERYGYNNINGKLYFKIDSSNSEFAEEKGYLSFIEFHLSTEMNLEFPLRTFKQSPNGPYVIDNDCNFRYALLDTDEALQHYVKESKDESHNTVTFLDIASIEAIQKTKIYAIAQFKWKVQEKLSEYFDIDFEYLEHEHFTKATLESINSNYDLTKQHSTSFFNKRGVYLINLANGDEKADSIQDTIVADFLKGRLNVEVKIVNEIVEDAFNIVIAHNKKYYITHKIPEQDPYKEVHKHKIVQFVTVEDFKPKQEDEDPYFLKIVNELEIAGEILDGKLKHVWQAVNKDWNFIRYTVDKKHENIHFYKVNVTTKDTLEFSHFDYSDLLFDADKLDFEAIKVIEYVAELERKNLDEYFEEGENNGLIHYGETVEGLCYSDINNIHTIVQTHFHTLPNYDAIVKDIQQTSDNYKINLNEVREYITSVMEKSLSKDRYQKLIKRLEKYGDSTDFKTIKESKIFNHIPTSPKDNWIRELIDGLYEEKGILVALEIRSKRMKERYELSNITDIQYFNQERAVFNKERDISKEIPCLSYICGRHSQGMQSSLPVGCLIRSVIWQNACEFEELIKTMAVDFVRNDYYFTVLPFPFKYLREYSEMVVGGVLI